MSNRRPQHRGRLPYQRTRYVPHARQLYNQLREAERRRRANSNIARAPVPPPVPGGRNEPPEVPPLTEEEAMDLLTRDVIGSDQKDRIISTRNIFLRILSKHSEIILPTRKEIVNKDICAVCLAELEPFTTMRKLTCAHAFHIECIDRWLLTYLTCPLCRRGILGNQIEIYERAAEEDGQPEDFPPENFENSDSEDSDRATPNIFVRNVAINNTGNMDSSDEPSDKRQRLSDEFTDGAGPSGHTASIDGGYTVEYSDDSEEDVVDEHSTNYSNSSIKGAQEDFNTTPGTNQSTFIDSDTPSSGKSYPLSGTTTQERSTQTSNIWEDEDLNEVAGDAIDGSNLPMQENRELTKTIVDNSLVMGGFQADVPPEFLWFAQQHAQQHAQQINPNIHHQLSSCETKFRRYKTFPNRPTPQYGCKSDMNPCFYCTPKEKPLLNLPKLRVNQNSNATFYNRLTCLENAQVPLEPDPEYVKLVPAGLQLHQTSLPTEQAEATAQNDIALSEPEAEVATRTDMGPSSPDVLYSSRFDYLVALEKTSLYPILRNEHFEVVDVTGGQNRQCVSDESQPWKPYYTMEYNDDGEEVIIVSDDDD